MSPRVIWVCKKNIWERIYNVSYTIFALEFFILFTTFIMGFAKKTLMIAVVLLTAVSSETMAKWEHRSTEAANLLRYMEDNVGKKMLTGVHASVNYNTYEADWVYSHTGKYPAINCMDFIHDVYSHSGGWIDYGNPNIALSWVNNGGIMAAMCPYRDCSMKYRANTRSVYMPIQPVVSVSREIARDYYDYEKDL